MKTLRRVLPMGPPRILTTENLRVLTERTLGEIGLPPEQAVYEPMGKNTAPAIGFMCHLLMQEGLENEIVGFYPADALVGDETAFRKAVGIAAQCAERGQVVTLGVKPTHPTTGYGYIEMKKEAFYQEGDLVARNVVKFHEKPDAKTAQKYLESSNFCWNAGMFVFEVKTMAQHFATHQPEMWKALQKIKEDLSNAEKIYSQLEPISIDFAIMEKIKEQVCVPCDMEWNDLGSWEQLAEALPKNKSSKNIQRLDSDGSSVFSMNAGKIYCLIGAPDMILVDTSDALLLMKKGTGQSVKEIVGKVKTTHPGHTDEHTFEMRPWGRFEILRDRTDFKSKIISVDPGARLSYQSHEKRSEHWVVIHGEGEVILEDKVIPVTEGTYVHIPLKAKHRITNTGEDTLEFIEVQTGSYFGEDDIVRYQDDYSRETQ